MKMPVVWLGERYSLHLERAASKKISLIHDTAYIFFQSHKGKGHSSQPLA
jgi:hypothetical protein